MTHKVDFGYYLDFDVAVDTTTATNRETEWKFTRNKANINKKNNENVRMVIFTRRCRGRHNFGPFIFFSFPIYISIYFDNFIRSSPYRSSFYFCAAAAAAPS